MEKKLSKNLVENSMREALFIGSQNYSRWQPEKFNFDQQVDQQVDRPTVIFLTVEPPVNRPVDRPMQNSPTGRPPGQPGLKALSLSVDHPVNRRYPRVG